jgi:hypothetical protein
MVDRYNKATVSPSLPASLFSEEELRNLESACGLSSERDGENLSFFAATWFCDEAEDGSLDSLGFMQTKLRQLDPAAYPHIEIHGAATCSKIGPDELGGFAYFITRDEIRSISTWRWLYEQARPETPDREHALEPWTESGMAIVQDAHGHIVADCDSPDLPDHMHRVNARRIVDAVNACKGISAGALRAKSRSGLRPLLEGAIETAEAEGLHDAWWYAEARPLIAND